MTKRLTSSLLLAAALAVPAAASADTTIAPDTKAGPLTALDGTVVWVTGTYKKQSLMQYTADGGVQPVKGAKTVTSYRSIDLGRDSKNRLVLTYLRCDSGAACKAYRDDLAGHRATFQHLATKSCTLITAPAYWRTSLAYGQQCTKGSKKANDPKRSGLYVKTGSNAPRQMHRPKDAIKFNIDRVSWVDLRGTNVAAVVSDIYEYSFQQTLDGKNMRSALISASEGDSDEHVRGLALGSGSRMWTLVNASHTGDPDATYLNVTNGNCGESEEMLSPGNDVSYEYRATALAVDGDTIYLTTPDAGIVTHEFHATRSCE